MDWSFILIVALAIVVVVAVIVMSYYQNQKRMQDMRALAGSMGYEYVQEAGLDGGLAGLALFSHGHTRKATNLLSSAAGSATVTIMDYRYESGYGRNRRIQSQSVLLFESDRLNLPLFVLHPEGVFQKLGGLLGQQDIDFDNQPDFSAAYVLQGSDEAQVRALFSSDKLAFLARRPGLNIEGQGQRLIYYRARKLLSPKAIPSFVEEGLAFLNLLGEAAPLPAGEPDPLAGLDELLAEIGVEAGPPTTEE